MNVKDVCLSWQELLSKYHAADDNCSMGAHLASDQALYALECGAVTFADLLCGEEGALELLEKEVARHNRGRPGRCSCELCLFVKRAMKELEA